MCSGDKGVGSSGRSSDLAELRCDDELMSQTALIVDDHRLFRASARMLLESEGFDVVGEAADGAEAVSEADQHLREQLGTASP